MNQIGGVRLLQWAPTTGHMASLLKLVKVELFGVTKPGVNFSPTLIHANDSLYQRSN